MTSIQLPYRLLQEAMANWLAGLNPRHLPVNLPLLAAFIAGLLWTRGRATCASIAAGGAVSHDALNRLLKSGSVRPLLQSAALALVNRIGGYLVIDDVVIAKRGKHIPGVTKLYAPGEGRYLLGLNVVVLAWTDGRGRYVPLSFRFWKPPAWKKDKHRSTRAFDGTPFKTKLQLAVELLDWAHQRGFEPTAVLFDAYYLARPVLGYLRHRDWHWVSRLKANRTLKRGKTKCKPCDLGRGGRATLAGWGEVRVVSSQLKSEGTTRYLIGSNPNWGHGRIEGLYGHRWGIEVLFRDGKQLAGLGDCQCRDFQAQENHVALVLLAEVFLGHQAAAFETSGSVIRRVSERAIVLAEAPVPAKLRPVRLRKNSGSQKAHRVYDSRGSA